MPVQPVYVANVMYNEQLNIGAVTVSSAGTAVRLSATSVECKEVVIQAKGPNTGAIFIGPSNVSNNYTGGVALNPFDIYVFPTDNLNKVWINAINSGDGVQFSYWAPVS